MAAQPQGILTSVFFTLLKGSQTASGVCLCDSSGVQGIAVQKYLKDPDTNTFPV